MLLVCVVGGTKAQTGFKAFSLCLFGKIMISLLETLNTTDILFIKKQTFIIRLCFVFCNFICSRWRELQFC